MCVPRHNVPFLLELEIFSFGAALKTWRTYGAAAISETGISSSWPSVAAAPPDADPLRRGRRSYRLPKRVPMLNARGIVRD